MKSLRGIEDNITLKHIYFYILVGYSLRGIEDNITLKLIFIVKHNIISLRGIEDNITLKQYFYIVIITISLRGIEDNITLKPQIRVGFRYIFIILIYLTKVFINYIIDFKITTFEILSKFNINNHYI